MAIYTYVQHVISFFFLFFFYPCAETAQYVQYSWVHVHILLEALLCCRWICPISYNTNQSLSVAPLLCLFSRSHSSYFHSVQLPPCSPVSLCPSLLYAPFSSSPPSHTLGQLFPPLLLSSSHFLPDLPSLAVPYRHPSLYSLSCSPLPPLSVTDGKQVLFSQPISSFPPHCFVALVSKWWECIWWGRVRNGGYASQECVDMYLLHVHNI